MKPFKFGPLAVDPAEYASHGNAILGIRGSGKSYTATSIAEHLYDAGIPFLAFDPIGIWRWLRVPGAGKGYPIVVAGGKDGDLPLSVAGAPAIVRAAMQGGVSLVIDLFDINLSKSDWRKIVTASVRTLLHENHAHGLRHLFLEEAAEFIPQKVNDWDVYAEIEKLARMGGNSRLGYTLINQRSQEVSKAILELCENVFLHRQRGKNALENMDKWLLVAGATEQREIIRSLPDLPQGECWAWLGGDRPTPPTRIKVPTKNSAHPDRRVMHGDATIKAKPVDVGKFVTGMRGQLEKIVEEAKANDPAELRKEVARLKGELAKKPAAAPPASIKAEQLEAARLRGWNAHAREIGALVKAALIAAQKTERRLGGIIAEATEIKTGLADLIVRLQETPSLLADEAPPAARTATPPAGPQRTTAERGPGAGPNGASPSGESKPRMDGAVPPVYQRILDALAELAAIGLSPADRVQLGLWLGMTSSSGSFRNHLGGLRSAGLIAYPSDGKVALTDHGIAVASAPSALPTTEALQATIEKKLTPVQWRILCPLIAAHPEPLSRERLGALTDLEPTSGSFRNHLGAMRSLGLIDYPEAGQVAATSLLFVEGAR